MPKGQTYLEIVKVGNSLRVAAIDADTGEEVVFQAPVNTPRSELERVAIAKLNKKLGRQSSDTKRPGTGPGRGISI